MMHKGVGEFLAIPEICIVRKNTGNEIVTEIASVSNALEFVMEHRKPIIVGQFVPSR